MSHSKPQFEIVNLTAVLREFIPEDALDDALLTEFAKRLWFRLNSKGYVFGLTVNKAEEEK